MSTTKKRPVSASSARDAKGLPGLSHFAPRTNILIGATAAALAAAAGLLYLLPMQSQAGVFGFPADDSYIPLTFAMNLREFGAYSFFRNEMVTSGSTSPLYVFVLALLGVVSSHGVAVAALIGMLSFAATAWFLHRLALVLFADEHWLAAVVVGLFVLAPRLQGAAVSGSSAMLYTALTVASAYFYFTRRSVAFFALAGLALWVRPDALVFLIAAMLHLAYNHVLAPRADAPRQSDEERDAMRKRTRIGGIAFVVFLLGYVGFNAVLSGTITPNTVGAKLAYYGGLSHPPFLAGVFTVLSHAGGAATVLFLLIGAVDSFVAALRRRPAPFLMAALLCVGTVAAYGFFLPFLFDDARYLVPMMPFAALLGVNGVRRAVVLLQAAMPLPGIGAIAKGIAYAVFGAAAILHIANWNATRQEYYKAVRYVEDRHVAAARWVRNNTPGDAVVAAHTIGTMGFYGQRKLIDITGVVTPAMIASIGNLLHLETYLKGMRAGYLVTLRERFEVVNANPLFTSDVKTPEVMEVFAFTPGRTHIMPQRASALNRQAAQYMTSRMDAEALPLLQQSYELDRNSARTCTLLGVAMLNLGDTARSLEALGKALRLQPDYGPAMVPFGDAAAARKDYTTALSVLRNAVRLMPGSKLAVEAYNRAAQRQYEDSLAALGFKRMRFRD